MNGSSTNFHSRVSAHYTSFDSAARILSELAKRGLNLGQLSPPDLETYDQLHTCGAGATRTLVRLLNPPHAGRILDVGCGIGGPARMLAAATGCSVVGVDLTPAFVSLASDLTARTNLSDRVSYQVGSATDLPFPDAAFDGAWHVHMSMNVAHKPQMYREIFRVLRPKARFVMFDPVRGPGPQPDYPVPWAETSETSFVTTAADMQRTIEQAGFVTQQIEDATDEGLSWFAELDRKRPVGAPVSADRFAVMSANHRKNLATGAIALMRGIFMRNP